MRAILQELVYDTPVGGAVWPFDRGYIRPPHFHGQVELLLIRAGHAMLHLGERSMRVRPGQLCWILPCVPHVMSGFSPDFDMWVAQFEPALVAGCWRAIGGRAKSAARALDACDAFEGIADLGERLAAGSPATLGSPEARDLSELATRVWNAWSPAGVRAPLRALCQGALRGTLASVGAGAMTSLADVASCLLLASPLADRRTLALDLGVSEGFLSRSFGRELGVSFVEHRARARLAHFLVLVQGGQPGDRPRSQYGGPPNLLQAALEAGFGSYSQFHRVFTRVAGVRPRDYLGGGRQRLQLFVAGDLDQPQAAPMRRLPPRDRQRARFEVG